MFTSAMITPALHAAADLLLLAVLTGLAYGRQRRNPQMVLVLWVLNLGLFATLLAISGESFTTGAGFGLFGLLSLIRLRSASFTSIDMAYSFVALVLGLVLGLTGIPLAMSASLGAVLIAAVLIGDHPRVNPPTQVITLTLDRAHGSAFSARMDAGARLAMPIRSLSIEEVDFVRDITKVVLVVGEFGAVDHGMPEPLPGTPAEQPATAGDARGAA